MAILTPEIIKKRQQRISRRRAIILTALYLLFVVHWIHWKTTGRTISPAELNETMYTIEKGVITVGTILMALILLSVAFFGRFFCSWGCHVLALQDLASWILGKCGIKPKPVRSRILPIIAIGAILYMFVWPTILRIWDGIAWPGFRVLTDETGLGSFTTEQFTRNLPGPLMTGITFLVVGFVVVWLLSSRSFCRYVCPYGALFATIDRISPAGIQLVGSCDGCGQCTAACTSHIRVHHEVQVHGRVVTPGCLKDLDCVASCPRDALAFGYSKPPLLRSFDNFFKPSVPWAWTWPQEIVAAIVCLATILVTRQLYGEIPFLLAITIGAIVAWGSVTTMKLLVDTNLRVGRFQLKHRGVFKPVSIAWVFGFTIAVCLLVHCGWIRWHEYQGQRAWNNVQNRDRTAIPAMVYHLTTVIDHGLWHPPYADRLLADLYVQEGEFQRAIPHLEYLSKVWPESEVWNNQLDAARLRVNQTR